MTTTRVTVSGVRNRTHMVYVASWLRHVVERHDGPLTLVEVNGDGRLSAEFRRPDTLMADLGTVALVDAHPPAEGRHYFVSIGSPGMRAWARFRCAPSAWPLRTVVVDEGIGSYGDVSTKRAAMRREGAGEPWATARAWAGAVARRTLPDEWWRLYERTDAGWAVNDAVAAEFRRASRHRSHPERVVFVTQPWVDHGLIEERDYVAHLADVSAEVTRVGAEFVIRPHPTEPVGRYEPFRVLDSTMPAELDAEVLGARLVLGETSTALLNLAAVHGVPAARVIGPLAAVPSIALSATQNSLFTQFVPTSLTVSQVGTLVAGSARH